jgi:hypothetical protein
MINKMQKKSFIRSGQGKITSYDFVDSATGVGYKTFYGISTYEASTKVYTFVTEAIDSEDYETQSSGVGNTLSLSFDITFNNPITLQGKAVIASPIKLASSANETTTITTTQKLYVVRSGVETQIGSTVTKTISGAVSAGNPYWDMLVGRVDVPITQIKKGNIIRVKIDNTDDAGSANAVSALLHDPKRYGVTSTILNTAFTLQLPIKVAL